MCLAKLLPSDLQTCKMLGFLERSPCKGSPPKWIYPAESVYLKSSLPQCCGTNDFGIFPQISLFYSRVFPVGKARFVTFQWHEMFVNPSRGKFHLDYHKPIALVPFQILHPLWQTPQICIFKFSLSVTCQNQRWVNRKKSLKSWVCHFEIICNGFAALQDLFRVKWNLTFASCQYLVCTQPEQEELQPSNRLQNSKLELFMRKNCSISFSYFQLNRIESKTVQINPGEKRKIQTWV